MALVFGAIAPHGGLAIAEACSPDERDLALATREGMTELGRLFDAARPEVVVVATPHNVHIPNALGVIVSGVWQADCQDRTRPSRSTSRRRPTSPGAS